MYYDENTTCLGEDNPQNLSLSHATKQGTHDAVSDIIRYTVLLGTAAMVAGIIFPDNQINRTIKKVLK